MQGWEVRGSYRPYMQISNVVMAVNTPRYVSLSSSHTTLAFSWPSPAVSPTPSTFMRFPTSPLRDPFSALPAELLFDILRQLPIRTLLAFSSVSRSLHALLTFLNQTIKAVVLSGSEFWILPVTTKAGEEERALHVAKEWLATASPDRDVLLTTPESPFHSSAFPYLAFVHACYESDSMRNRQRLWNIVKQFDSLWRDYRLHGWQRDVFIA